MSHWLSVLWVQLLSIWRSYCTPWQLINSAWGRWHPSINQISRHFKVAKLRISWYEQQFKKESTDGLYTDSPNHFLYHMLIEFNLFFSYGTYYFITCIMVLIKISFTSSRLVLPNRNIMEPHILCLLVVTLKITK